jgi:hypothetical protein
VSPFNVRRWNENDMAKVETLVGMLPEADVVVRIGRRPVALAATVHQPGWSSKMKPADSARNPSNADPGPSGFDWTEL